MTRSLRRRLLVGMVAGTSAMLIVFGLVIYFVVRHALNAEFDGALATAAKAVASQVERENGKLVVEYDELQMPEFSRKHHSMFFQIWRADGQTLARSPNLGQSDLEALDGRVARPQFTEATLPSGRRGRLAGFVFLPYVDERSSPSAPPATAPSAAAIEPVHVTVAMDVSGLEGRLRLLRWLLLGTSFGVAGAAVVLSTVIVRRGLRPLDLLAAQIASLDEDQLTRRIDLPGIPDELTPVTDRLNALLGRLEAAFERERGFTADVAHELRTPLAGVQSIIEVARSKARPPAEYQESLEDCLAITRQMQAMVDNLLMLAKLDAGQIRVQTQPVQLGELVDACWQHYADKAAARRIAFTNQVPPDVVWSTDREILSLVLSNVLANAVQYADQAGKIWVEFGGGGGELSVANTGCRLSAEQASQVFRRFWRGDQARNGLGDHCGLGLAIVDRAMHALGGAARAAAEPAGVFRLSVRLNDRPSSFDKDHRP